MTAPTMETNAPARAGWLSTTVKVSNEQDVRTVPAYERVDAPGLAIAVVEWSDATTRFTVTHVRSGLLLATDELRSFDDAARFFDQIAPLANWTLSGEQLRRKRGLVAMVRALAAQGGAR